jgi:hypothetical protein
VLGDKVAPTWREQVLARATEIEGLSSWLRQDNAGPDKSPIVDAINMHLRAARDSTRGRRILSGAAREGSIANLDAADTLLLNLAPDAYIRSLLPKLLIFAVTHLPSNDPRRIKLENISKQAAKRSKHELTRDEIGSIISAYIAATSARDREFARVRSFRNVIYLSTVCLALGAVAVAIIAAVYPSILPPLCFNPDNKVVCPTASASVQENDLDAAVTLAASRWDYLVVEIGGLMAGAVAAAASMRFMRGLSSPYGIPEGLTFLKLPMGALSAVVGLYVVQAQLLIGLSVPSSSSQILAYALVLGFGQQVLTRPIDELGSEVVAEGNVESSSARVRGMVANWLSALR